MLALAVWTVEALLQIAVPSDPQIRPDGREYAYVLRGSVHVATLPGAGASRAIAKGARPRWSPDSKSLALLADGQVYVWSGVGRSGRVITKSPSPVTAFSWFPDSRSIAYVAADSAPAPDPVVVDQDYRYSRLYRQKIGGGGPERITNADRHVVSFSIRPDGRGIVYAAQPTPRNRDAFNVDLYEVDLAAGRDKVLVAQAGRDADPSYSPDGNQVVFHSQAGSTNYFEARELATVSAGGGPVRYLTRGHSDLDVFRGGTQIAWSTDAQTFVYTAGQGVKDVLVRHDLKSGSASVLATAVAGGPSCTPDLRACVLLKTAPERPPEIFLWEGGSETQLTRHQDAISKYPSVRSQVVRWTSADRTPVEGILWLPVGYVPGKRVPLLTELHGGPTGVTLNAFPLSRIYPIPVLLQHGFAVFSPNFRGSVNYGAPFRLKNSLAQGVGDYQDVISGIDALIAKGIADPERLGIMGWSYGGYLAGSVLTQTTRFRAASIGAPATDWLTYYGQSDAAPEVLATYFGGSPWEVPENYIRHSSRTGLKNIRTPALLQVGSLDINHNGEIHRALVDHNVPVEYVIYPREGHAITEPAHVRDVLERNLRWFLKWIPPNDPGVPTTAR